MMVSIELVTTIVTVASTLLGLAAGFGWIIARMDARFEGFEQRMDARFEKVDSRFDRLEGDVAGVKAELGEVKIAIARLEGPVPRLSLSR